MLGVAAATNCRSDKEKDRQGGFGRVVGDDDLMVVDFLHCGCKGGRQVDGKDEIELESELPRVVPRATVLRLELVNLFDISLPLLLKG